MSYRYLRIRGGAPLTALNETIQKREAAIVRRKAYTEAVGAIGPVLLDMEEHRDPGRVCVVGMQFESHPGEPWFIPAGWIGKNWYRPNAKRPGGRVLSNDLDRLYIPGYRAVLDVCGIALTPRMVGGRALLPAVTGPHSGDWFVLIPETAPKVECEGLAEVSRAKFDARLEVLA